MNHGEATHIMYSTIRFVYAAHMETESAWWKDDSIRYNVMLIPSTTWTQFLLSFCDYSRSKPLHHTLSCGLHSHSHPGCSRSLIILMVRWKIIFSIKLLLTTTSFPYWKQIQGHRANFSTTAEQTSNFLIN